MKLFMRNHYDNPDHTAVIKEPMSYAFICLRCAGTMGGKPSDRMPTWHIAHCDCCGLETAVTQPRDFIWRK